jgi:hypothetical protein
LADCFAAGLFGVRRFADIGWMFADANPPSLAILAISRSWRKLITNARIFGRALS